MMGNITKSFILIVLGVIVSGELKRPVTRTVQTNYGKVRGLYQTSDLLEKSFYSFRGIPYAKPPINELRFKAPEPIEPWHPNVINAYNYRNACMQPYTPEIETGTSEDCLYLNIYVPIVENAVSDEKLPILFFIHGGAFFKNAADGVMNSPDFLIQHDVILVTMNFRHNIFGHLSLRTPEISGNQDLKDQLIALQWTHENIACFGGDPNRITVAGHSSGAMSANYLAISPISLPYVAGLFSIGASLAGIPVWNHHEHLPDMLQRTNTTNIDDLISLLMSAPSETILNIAYPIEYFTPFGMYWGPVIEHANAIRPFITEDPVLTYKSQCSGVPTLFAFADMEAFPVVPSWKMIKNETAVDEFIETFDVPLPIRYYDDLTHDDKQAFHDILNEMKKFYFSDARTHDEKVQELLNLFSDNSFTYMFLNGYKLHRQNACHDNTYLFQMGLDGAFNFGKEPSQFNLSEYHYTGHVDILNYLFPLKTHLHVYERVLATKETNEFSRISWDAIEFLPKMCTNFVKYGKPMIANGPEFPTMQENVAPYMKLGRSGQPSVENEPFRGVLEFYDELLARSAIILDEIRTKKLSPEQKTEL